MEPAQSPSPVPSPVLTQPPSGSVSQHTLTRTTSVFGEKSFHKADSLSWQMASVLVVGDVAGCGMLALSYALTKTGFAGGAFVAALGVLAAYCGHCLSHCWLIIEKRCPQLAVKQSRAPYPEIAAQALGAAGAAFTSVMLMVCTFGSCIVYLILVAQMAASLLHTWPLTYCHWTVVVIVLLVPPSWAGSMSELWWVGAVSLLTSLLTWLLLMASLLAHFAELRESSTFTAPGVMTAFSALGPILFGYGGAAAFPTIQNDMRERHKFSKALCVGYVVLVCMYTSLSVLGYAALGSKQDSNIIETLNQKVGNVLVVVCEVLFLIHLSTAFLVIMNPFFLEMEDLANIPNRNGIVRMFFRSFIMIAQLVIALLVPDFIRIVDIIGATAMASIAFILPPIFRLKLLSDKPPAEIVRLFTTDNDSNKSGLANIPGWNETPLPWWEKILMFLIPLFGTVFAMLATISEIQDITRTGLNTASCLLPSKNHSLWTSRAT